MRQDPRAERSLPAHGAFVVPFGMETDVTRGQFVGRVEHVVSGQAAHFCTLEARLAFVGRVLAHVHGQPVQTWRAAVQRWRPAATAAIQARDVPGSEVEEATS
jgi:hypothetical protein